MIAVPWVSQELPIIVSITNITGIYSDMAGAQRGGINLH